MRHFGDITKIDGHKLPIVDVVTGGSPCQDLSVAGKRAGLAGERSGLFMEQIRIIKEMREEYVRTHGSVDMVRPRWMVWENVPGAFSSNGGEDFRAVLEETARVCDPNAVIPGPPGKWTPSGAIMGDGWSIAWRVHDAQFWGVPQRRKRIALVADFGGASAPKILFERKGLSGDSEPGGAERQGTAGGAEESSYRASGFKGGQGANAGSIGYRDEQSPTLGGVASGSNQIPDVMAYGFSSFDSNAMKSRNPHSGIYEADTSRTLDLNGGNPACNQGGWL